MQNRNVKNEIDHFKKLLNNLQFDELAETLMVKPVKVIEDILLQLAYNPSTEESNLLVYTFLQKILCKQETSVIHLVASRLMGLILNYIDKAELIGLYHGLRANELDPDNIDILEYLLYFNHIPEKLLDDPTAIQFAQKIILKRPESKAALMTLSKVKN